MGCNCNTPVPCNYQDEPDNPNGCTGMCSSTSSIFKNDLQAIATTQKIIWNQSRVSSSLYMMNRAAMNIGAQRSRNPPNINNNNQSSDRSLPSVQTYSLPSHGNSRRTTLTSLKPGACMSGGKGVDIKHNSYARYLGRKKSCNLKTQLTTAATFPLSGNKKQMFGLIASCGK